MGLFSSIGKIAKKATGFLSGNSDTIGSIASGLLNIGGSSANSALSYKYSKALMEAQQQWQEKMSNTSHQRETADLLAAGLNPILSANSGSTWGSASSMSADIDTGIGSAVSSALQYREAKQNLEQVKKNIELTEEQRTKTVSEVANLKKQNNLLDEEYFRSVMNTESFQKMLDLELANKQAQNDLISAQTIAQLSENPYIARKNAALIDQIKSQTSANSASAYYNYRRSLGRTDTESRSYSGRVFGVGGSYTSTSSHTR